MAGVVEDIAGSMLICIFLAAILYGVTTTQTFMYYQSYPKDRTFLKVLVGLMWILETLHIAFCIDFIYNYTITNFGNEEALDHIYWSGGITVGLGVIVAGVVHGFYIRRIWILSNNHIFLTAGISLVALLRFAFGLTTTSLCYIIPFWSTFRERQLPLITLVGGLSSAAIVDLTLAVSLIYMLEHSRTGFQRSDSRINFLMAYTVNTGAITTVFSVLIVIFYASMRSKLVFLGLVEIQSKLYANSFLASLNSRQHALSRGRKSQNAGENSHLERTAASAAPGVQTQIEILRETTQMFDEMPLETLQSLKHKESFP